MFLVSFYRLSPSSTFAHQHLCIFFHAHKQQHCRVPHGYPLNKKLAWWVMNQRAQYAQRHKKETNWLTKERLKQLDDLGFDWNPKGGGAKKTEKNASKSRKKKVTEEKVKKS